MGGEHGPSPREPPHLMGNEMPQGLSFPLGLSLLRQEWGSVPGLCSDFP